MASSLRKSLDELRSQSKSLLEASGVVTNLSDGGVARSLLDITTLQISELYDAFDFQSTMSRLSTASGVFLDLIGQSRGVPRSSSLTAVVTVDDQAIKFFSVDGKTPLKTLLSGQKVANGTLVKSSDGVITYQVTEDVYPDDIQVELFVPAVSQSTGSSQNVGKGVLSTHNLGVGSVSVTNAQAITTGQDTESDSNYRFRISRAVSQAAGATEDAIRLAALSFPGVASVTLRPFSNGVGTFDVLVVPVGNTISPDVLRAIEAVVLRAAAFGTRVNVVTPTQLPVELVVQLTFRANVTAVDKASIRESVRQAILAYLGSIDVGGTFVLNELTQIVMDVSDQIFDMNVLLYRFRGVNQVLRNVQAENDELFLPDSSSQNPIRVV